MSCAVPTTRRASIHPQPRTLSAVRHFRNVARALCSVAAASSGAQSQLAQGGLVATLRLAVDEADEARMLASVERTLLPVLAAASGVAAVRVLIADRAASAMSMPSSGRVARRTSSLLRDRGGGLGDEASFRAAVDRHCGAEALAAIGWREGGALGFYRHELTVTTRLTVCRRPCWILTRLQMAWEWFVYVLYAAAWERSRRREDKVTPVTLSRRESILAAFAAAAMATTSLGGEVRAQAAGDPVRKIVLISDTQARSRRPSRPRT